MNVLIFAQGRTGSSVFEDLIASTGFTPLHEICKKGEVPLPYVRDSIAHVKVWHLADPATYLQNAIRAGWRILYLRRLDIVRHAMSAMVAEERGYNSTKERPGRNLKALRVDLGRFSERIFQQREWYRAEQEALATIARSDFYQVAYETHLLDSRDHQQTVDSVRAWLGLEPVPVVTDHLKVVSWPLRDLILNYEEFVSCCVGLDIAINGSVHLVTG